MALTATDFNAWMVTNVSKLIAILNSDGNIDNDAFQDAYIILATSLSPHNQNASDDYETIFKEIYAKNLRKNISESFSTLHPDTQFFTQITAEETDPKTADEEADRTQKLIIRMRKYMLDTFPKTEVMAFKMKTIGYSYRDISDALGIGRSTIDNAIKKIIAQTGKQFGKSTF